jgi:hypothetical protein
VSWGGGEWRFTSPTSVERTTFTPWRLTSIFFLSEGQPPLVIVNERLNLVFKVDIHLLQTNEHVFSKHFYMKVGEVF